MTLLVKKHEIIIGIDANEPFASSRGYVARLYSKCKLIDTIAQHHGITNKPNIFIRGSQGIDFLFCSKTISSFITSYGIPSFEYISSSDHRSIFIDINIVQYLRNPFIDTNTNKLRLLQSNHPSKVRQYKDELISYNKKERSFQKQMK